MDRLPQEDQEGPETADTRRTGEVSVFLLITFLKNSHKDRSESVSNYI